MLAAAMAAYLLLPLLLQKAYLECALRGALLLAVGALAAGSFLVKDAGWVKEEQALISGQQVMVCAKVVRKELKNGRWQFTLLLPGYENQVIVSAEDGEYSLDCVLSIKGTIRDFENPRNEGQFNEKNYYKSKQIIGRIFPEEIRCIRAPAGIFAWREWLYALRLRICQIYEDILPAQEAGIMAAMAPGETSMLDAGVKSLFQQAGISHILAISGMHISMIGMGLYLLLRRCRQRYVVCAGMTAGLLFLYGTMIGMSVSAKRAIGMFFIYMLAQCLGRGYDALSALSVLALFLLFQNPFLLHQVSFQFSFAAAFAVVTIGDVFRAPEADGLSARMFRAVGAGLLLQLFTLPLVAYYYYELPLCALFLNLLLLPYLGVALGFGLLGGIIGIVWLPLARILLMPCHLVLFVYLWVCSEAAKLPYSTVICGRPSAAKLWIYYGLLAVVFWMLRRRRELAARTEDEKEEQNAPSFYSKGLFVRLFVSAAVLLLLLVYVPPGGFEIDYLDVGQGDGSMLRTANGVVCFVDGGSSDVSGVGTYRMLPFLKSKGIRRVDYWILSHLDEDHVNGFYEVLESGYEIGAVVLAETMPQDEAREKLLAALEQYQVPVVWVRGGDAMQLHNTGNADDVAGARLYFLSPDETTPFSDGNGASLVCLYEDSDIRALWTGDIGAEQEEWLSANTAVKNIDIYKAAHHGSKYSNSETFLQTLSPGISIVSCSEKNRYGHPGAEAVASMESCGSRIFYTMKSGQVQIRRDQRGIVVKEFLRGWQENTVK